MDQFEKINQNARKWILWGIPVISLFGSMTHSIYKWTGQIMIAGIFSPVNESIWEHLKMSLWMTLIWWIAGYFILGRKAKLSARQWFAAASVSLLVCPLFITVFYYTYTGAFGIHSLILDVASLFIGVILAQYSALHIYNFAKVPRRGLYPVLIFILLIITVFIVFTFLPPHIPLFQDSISGQYGIAA